MGRENKLERGEARGKKSSLAPMKKKKGQKKKKMKMTNLHFLHCEIKGISSNYSTIYYLIVNS